MISPHISIENFPIPMLEILFKTLVSGNLWLYENFSCCFSRKFCVPLLRPFSPLSCRKNKLKMQPAYTPEAERSSK